MNTIHKYPLQISLSQGIETAVDAEILCVQLQNDIPCVWMRVDIDAPKSEKTFYIITTGMDLTDLPSTAKYLGTVQRASGIVWHIYYNN